MPVKTILHIDLNAFFARAEAIRHPEWGDEPIIVGGEGSRGVVSTASYSARKKGVHSALSIAEARRLCPEGHFVPVDFAYYNLLSRSFMGYLREFAAVVEPASIDEAYVDLTSKVREEKDPLSLFKRIQTGLFDRLGLQSSLGIAPTRFLAKMGSDLKKPMGITVIRRRDIEKLIYPLPIEAYFGIGAKSAAALRRQGIRTIGELAPRLFENDPFLMGLFGKRFEAMKGELEGHSDDVVSSEAHDPKSVSHEETFPFDTDDEGYIKGRIRELASSLAQDLAKLGKKAQIIEVVAKDPSFRRKDRSKKLSRPIDAEDALAAGLLKIYEDSFLGQPLRLIGVAAKGLVDPKKETVQMSFFDYPEYEKMDETKLLIAEWNRRLKKPLLSTAAEKKGK